MLLVFEQLVGKVVVELVVSVLLGVELLAVLVLVGELMVVVLLVEELLVMEQLVVELLVGAWVCGGALVRAVPRGPEPTSDGQ